MKRYALLFVVVLVSGLFGCGNDSVADAEEVRQETKVVALAQSADPSPDAMLSKETFTARKAAREAVLTGFTRARNTMTLVSEVEGRVEKVLVDVGDTIGTNGVFAILDDTFVKLDLQKNRADQAQLKSELSYHRKELDRYRELVKGKTAAQSTLDSNVRDHDSTLQQLKSLQVEERRLLEKLARHTIKGPTGWKVVSRELEPGEWVTIGHKAGDLGNYSRLLVPFALSSEEYKVLKDMGDTVTLRLPDWGGKVKARVERVAPGYDPDTRKINVDLEIAKGDMEMRGGIRTELTLPLPDPGGAVLVPKSALVKAYEEYFLMNPDGERVRVMLLGSGGEGLLRVTSPDVRAGDSFILDPNS